MNKNIIIIIIVALLAIGGFTGYHMHVKQVENERIIQLMEEEKAAREKAEKERQEAIRKDKENMVKQHKAALKYKR